MRRTEGREGWKGLWKQSRDEEKKQNGVLWWEGGTVSDSDYLCGFRLSQPTPALRGFYLVSSTQLLHYGLIMSQSSHPNDFFQSSFVFFCSVRPFPR